MSWCYNCQKEYDSPVCPGCGAAPAGDAPEASAAAAEYMADTPVFLTSAEDGISAEMLRARLVSTDIPFMVKPHGSNGVLRVYMGPSNLGCDFYVPSRLSQKAREAISLEPEENTDEADGTGQAAAPAAAQPEAAGSVPPAKKMWGNVLVVLGILLVLAGLFSLEALLDFIRKLFGY